MSTPPSALTRPFENLTLPVATLSLSGELLGVNDALCRVLALPAASLVGRPLGALGQGPDAERAVLEALAAARAGEPGGELLQTWRRPWEPDRPLHVRIAWTRTDDPSTGSTYLTLVCVDETHLVEAERRALDSEARWRAMLANAADMTWSATADGTVLSVTAGVVGQLGRQVEEIVGRCAFEFVHPDDVAAFRAAWERLTRGDSRQEVLECRAANADGTWTWVQETLTDLRDDPHVRAVVGNVIDVTGRREAEAERSRLEGRFRARFERSLLPQTLVDLHGRLSDVNDAFCRLVGRSREQLLGSPVSDLAHRSDPHGLDSTALRALLRGEDEHHQVEGVLRAADGRPVPVMIDATLLRNGCGEPEGVATVVRDLSSLHDAERRQRQQEDFFLALNQRASDLSVVIDPVGCITYVSPATGGVLGFLPSDVLAEQVSDFIHPDDVADAARAHGRVLTEGGSSQATMRVRAADGSWRWMETAITNMIDTPVGGLVSNLRDITAEVTAREALQASETRYRAIVDTAQEGIWATAPDGSTLYANSRLAAMLDVPLEDLYERPAEVRRRLLGSAGTLDLLSARREATRHEVVFRCHEGHERTLSVASSALHTDDGTFLGSLAMATDITDARRLEKQLRHAALHDTLTNLPNRALLLDRLERALSREEAGTALLFIDLDQFKLVNDSRGHAVGDEVLVAVAQRLTETLRPRDTVARFGGDEFVVLCEDVDEELARSLAEELAATLREPLPVQGGTVHVTASIGVATSPVESGDDLLRYADTAMYAAKAAGRRRVHVFDPELSERAEQRYALSVDLREALRDDTLAMHYQPIIDLTSGAVAGVEGLARWHHPVRGSVSPAGFVPVAEDMGMAPDLDRWAVRRAVQDAAHLQSQGAMPAGAYVAANLSARNLGDRDLEPFILDCVAESGLTPAQVVLEVTESAIMDDTSLAVSLLGRLRERGFGIAMDDFGTGYSSLAYLRDLPITSLKVDGSFVRDIEQDKDALSIVTSIVDLARAVGVDVVAEGVETQTQAALLMALGCAKAQGWLWSHAQPVGEHLRSGELNRCYDVSTQDAPLRAPRRSVAEQVGTEHGLEELLELHRNGASPTTIAAALNRRGFATPAGTRWHRNVVARVITDRLTAVPPSSG